jgi:hypothetical protein
LARTEAGKALTEQHYQAQLKIRALALRDYLQLWPTWNGDSAGFKRLVVATIVLVKAHQSFSAHLGASYFDAFRLAEDPGGSAHSYLPDPMTPELEDRLAGALYETGQFSVQRSLASGKPPDHAMKAALTNTSGIVGNEVVRGGRGSILRSTANDPKSHTWARVTSGHPCTFCRLLASRGPVYESEATADFKAHGACSCTAEPSYSGSEWPGISKQFKKEYDEAVAQARETGELRRGTSNDLLNAYRRFLDQRDGSYY